MRIAETDLPGLERLVSSMSSAQAHRGPDSHGLCSEQVGAAQVALGFRRLAIIDLSERGNQPMQDTGSGVSIVFNGEIYNFVELRRELIARGHRFHSDTDTEVILKSYIEWGTAFPERLRGMFAFAILDTPRKKIFFARDRLGIKPLYVAQVTRDGAGSLPPCHETLLFASELRAILASGLVARKLDPAGLSSYLWNGFVVGPSTIVRGIRLLPAGHSLTANWSEDGRITTTEVAFWQLPMVRQGVRSSAAEVREHLETAVRIHLIADVPLGVFLSGGIDSSAMAALAQKASSGSVKTFNIRFDEAQFDESPHARAVAKALGTDHEEVTLTQAAFRSGLPSALNALDQPTFDGINTFFVSRAVREAGLTVALAGTGGDELFGGYSSFADLPRACRWARMASVVPAPVRDMVASAVLRARTGRAGDVRPQTRWGKLKDALATRGDPLSLYQVSYSMFTRDLLRELALNDVLGLCPYGLPMDVARGLEDRISDQPLLHGISLMELSLFLGERLLRDTDCASMAASLEVRVPMIDHVVVESLANLPAEKRFAPLRRKEFLRREVLGHLDASLFERAKAGFELPLATWCRNELAGDIASTFRDINLCHRVGLNAEVVSRIWRAFQAGAPGQYWSRVWSLYALLWWCQKHEVYL